MITLKVSKDKLTECITGPEPFTPQHAQKRGVNFFPPPIFPPPIELFMPNPSLDHDHRQPALPPTPMSVARPNAIKKRLPPSPASPLRPRPAQDPKPTEPKPKSLPPNPAPTPSPLPLKSSSDIKSTPNSSSLKRKAPDALDLDKEDGKGQTFKERFKERFNQISIVAQQERRLVKRRLSDQNESSDQSGEQSDQDSISFIR